MGRLKIDLHDIYSGGGAIEATLERAMAQAVSKRLELVEIIPGKGSGQLKKHVLRFLQRPDIKQLYHRLEKDDKHFGRIFVHFRHYTARRWWKSGDIIHHSVRSVMWRRHSRLFLSLVSER